VAREAFQKERKLTPQPSATNRASFQAARGRMIFNIEADLASKERALTKLAPAGAKVHRFKSNDELMAFLDTL
jgi:hypothetical protein